MKRGFLVGCGRSGTTLLHSMLAAHPKISAFPETSFFLSLGGYRHPWLRSPRDRIVNCLEQTRNALGLASRKARSKLGSLATLLGRKDLRPAVSRRHVTVRGYARGFLWLLDSVAADAGKSVWVEKSPAHIYYVDMITRCVPEAVFIHMVRSGPDTIASIFEATQKFDRPWKKHHPDLESCISRWISSVRITLDCLGRPGHFVLTYEDLVSRPREVLAGVCAALGVEYDPAMMADREQGAANLIKPFEDWKQNVLAPVANANGTKFEKLFGPDERALITKACSAIDLSRLALRDSRPPDLGAKEGGCAPPSLPEARAE